MDTNLATILLVCSVIANCVLLYYNCKFEERLNGYQKFTNKDFFKYAQVISKYLPQRAEIVRYEVHGFDLAVHYFYNNVHYILNYNIDDIVNEYQKNQIIHP